MLKNEMESYEKIGGGVLKNLTKSYMGVEGKKLSKSSLRN